MTPLTPQPDPRGPTPAGADRAPAAPAAVQPGAASGNARGWRLALLGAAAAAAAVVGLQLVSGSSVETGHANWAAVREASARPPGEVRWQDAAGAVQFVAAVPFGDEDRDPATTAAVQSALAAGDDAAVVRVIAAAQVPGPVAAAPAAPAAPAAAPAPMPTPEITPVPTLTPGMKAEIRRGDTGFVHLFLYDTCDEDGDVVDVLIDGATFATVRLTNRGVTLSVPVSAGGATRVQVRGVHDGGGGITVGCRTSRGQGFLRVLAAGDTETLAVVRK